MRELGQQPLRCLTRERIEDQWSRR
jgi:hypothetical protein